jgi:uncharacterized protein involved in tolerance to divalent cations
MTTFLEVKISAENPQQANDTLGALLEKRLVTGGQIIEAAAHFLWKGKINTMPNYCVIWSYTTDKHQQAVIDTVKAVSVEEVPMVWFTAINGNEELLAWIKETLT